MKVLAIGSGGREHALVWKIAQSPRVTRLFCAPGNKGMGSLAELIPIAIDDIKGLLAFVKKEGIDLTVVGPELPLSLGIVNRFKEEGLRIFGPSQAASKIETSKVFSKEVMEKYNIPTAKAAIFSHEEACQKIRSMEMPVVIKVDGLAAGKGVVIAHDEKEAASGLDAFKKMGNAASRIIIEEYLEGVEISFFVITDGVRALPLGSAQDHKPVFDGDLGPNTGGMGAFSPSPLMNPLLEAEIMSKVITPTLLGLSQEGSPYQGILYAGLILTNKGIYVLEFNARWGDPEAQTLLPRIKSDWLEVMELCLDGHLDQVQLDFEDLESVCIVLTSEGYPGGYRKGDIIRGIDEKKEDGVTLFHAGIERQKNKWLTCGGRVLGVTATGPTLLEARQNAYDTVQQITFPGMHYRTDIGKPSNL